MIPPTLMYASYLFTAVPIFEQEPLDPPSSGEAPPAGCTSAEAGGAPAPQAAGDADGINDQVAFRLVFKGFRWAAVPHWEAEVNPGYERWVEGRSDDAAEHAREDERTRLAAARARASMPTSAAGEAPAGSAAPATDDEG